MKKLTAFVLIMFHGLAVANICQVAVTDQYTQIQYDREFFPLYTGEADSREDACNIALNNCHTLLYALQDQGQFNTAYCQILK